jgi:hypothetical protein
MMPERAIATSYQGQIISETQMHHFDARDLIPTRRWRLVGLVVVCGRDIRLRP